MVSGTDEHGTPILVQADAEGLTPGELADKYNRVIVDDLQGLGLSLRPVHPHHHPQPLRGRPGPVPGLYDNGYFVPKTTMGAISPSTGRTLPDRYIEGTCPICGYDGARGDQCDNCGNQLDPIDLINPRSRINGETPKFVETEHFFLDLPGAGRVAGQLAADAHRLAAERAEVQPEPARRPPAAGDHPRPRLGRPGAARRLARPADEAALRLVRRGDRLPVGVGRVGPPDRRPGGLAAVVAGPGGRCGYYFMGKDNIVFHSRHLAGACCSATTAQGDHGGQAGPLGELKLPDEVVSSEFLTMSGSKFSTSPRPGHLRRRLPARVRPGRAALLHRRRRSGEPGHRLHLGRVRPPHQLRAGQRVGQPGQPLDLDGAQERRRDPERPTCATRAGRALLATVAGGVRHRRRAAAAAAGSSRRSARRCGWSARPTSTSPTPEPWKLQGRPGPPRHGPAHRAAGGARRQHAADAVPAARRAEGARGARRRRGVGGAAGDP